MDRYNQEIRSTNDDEISSTIIFSVKANDRFLTKASFEKYPILMIISSIFVFGYILLLGVWGIFFLIPLVFGYVYGFVNDQFKLILNLESQHIRIENHGKFEGIIEINSEMQFIINLKSEKEYRNVIELFLRGSFVGEKRSLQLIKNHFHSNTEYDTINCEYHGFFISVIQDITGMEIPTYRIKDNRIINKAYQRKPVRGEYICFNCELPQSYHGNLCRSCRIRLPLCIICYRDPEPGDTVIRFSCL